MSIKVYHSKDWALNSELHFVDSKDFCEKFHPYWVDGYKPMPMNYNVVAVVDTDDLEEAFRLTNSIDCPWQENSGVDSMLESARSTSVGDVMVDDNDKVWLVAGMGFTEVEWDDGNGMFKVVESRGGKFAVALSDDEIKELNEFQKLANELEEVRDRYEAAKKALKKSGVYPAVG